MHVKEYAAKKLRFEEVDLDYVLDLVQKTGTSDEARLFRAVTPTHDPDEFYVTPGSYVGRLGLPSGQWIDFISRFPFEDVIALIRQSGREPIRLDTAESPAASSQFLIETVALAFAREVSILAARGLAKGYHSRRQLEPPYAGRIDAAFHLGKLAARPDRLATIARRLSTDVPENQALALALDVLLRVPLSGEAGLSVARLMPVFARTVRSPMRAEDVAAITLNNLTHRYSKALALAEVILRSQSLAPISSGLAGGSVLFYMPKVWEGFVARWLIDDNPQLQVKAPYPFALIKDGLTAEADATVWNGSELVGLYDAKYKQPSLTPDRDDLYQMITYCECLGIDQATLVYPVDHPTQTFTVSGKCIRMMGLPPSSIKFKAVSPLAA